MPTVLAAAGARTPDDLPGLNLLSKISDGALIERDAIFGESFAHDVEDVVDPVASLNFRWIIEGRWKLLLTYDGTNGRNKFPADDLRPQLFDVVADPMETCNLAADHADLVQRLSDRIDQWWDAGQRRTTTEWSEQPVPVGR